MSDWDSLAGDFALAWWIADRDAAREAAREPSPDPAATQQAQQWAFRREVAMRGAALAALGWQEYVRANQTETDRAGKVLDEEAVRYLCALGFSRSAAIAALRASGWRGRTAEERTVEAILTSPPQR